MPYSKNKSIKNTVAGILAMVMVFLGSASLTGFNAESVYGVNENTDGPAYADNQIVVTFNDDIEKSSAADIVAYAISEEMISENDSSASSISTIKEQLSLEKIKTDDNMMLVETDSPVNVEAVAKEIEKNPDVSAAQPNYYYEITEGDSGEAEYEDGEWYLDYIDAEQAWDLIDEQSETAEADTAEETDADADAAEETADADAAEETADTDAADETADTDAEDNEAEADSNRVTVALLDTGVMTEQKGLSDVEIVNVNMEEEPSDIHGSEMAGLIAATAGNDTVSLLAVDVFSGESDSNKQGFTTTTDVVSGIDYACKHDARIITMAFGCQEYDKALDEKMIWAAEKDVLLVSAAGDKGTAEEWYPSDQENCLSCINTVKYTNAFDENCRNESSNYGDAKLISAPGTLVSVINAEGETDSKTGSSYSAAIVAGTAAMVMYANPVLSADDVEKIILDTANDIGEKGYDIQTASGNVNAYMAVAKAYDADVELSDEVSPDAVSANAKAVENGIEVSWDAVDDAEVYVVYRQGPNDDKYVFMEYVPAESDSWVDEDCSAGETYSYKIAAGKTSSDGKKLIGDTGNAVSTKASN